MDQNEIIKLLEAGKKIEAKKKLVQYLQSSELAPEDAGKLYVDLANLYLDSQNDILEKYKDFLDDVIKELKGLNAKEKEAVG